MPLAITYSRAYAGLNAPLVTVETHLSNGLPQFCIVGLPEVAVKESKDRVRSALLNSQFNFPARRITINLAPAELPKQGSHYDLAIALGILVASKQLAINHLELYEFAAELALSGVLRSVQGMVPFTIAATQAKRALLIAQGSTTMTTFIKEARVYCAHHLLDVVAHLNHSQQLKHIPYNNQAYQLQQDIISFEDIQGQPHAKRALEIAAAGQHHLLMSGPPGVGKTLLANSIRGLLPPLSVEKALEVLAISSLSPSGFDATTWRHPPFRSPHHTLSNIALVGGGRPPRPGEVSLAHHGILFLDELTEFQRNVLECLRQPLEARKITISRAGYQTDFPACFQLIAAMNPCPCGYTAAQTQACICTPHQIARYQAKISGPLRDRFDLQIFIPKVATTTLINATQKGDSTEEIKQRIQLAQERQLARQHKLNVELSPADIREHCVLKPSVQKLFETSLVEFQMSARNTLKILRLARSIADIAAEQHITSSHLAEALSYKEKP